MRNQTFAEGRHFDVFVPLLPMLLAGPDLVLEVQVVVPLSEVMDPFSPSNDRSPDQIGLVRVVAADHVPQVVV